MSRKTREEKKIAAYRKRLQLLQQINQPKSNDQSEKVTKPATPLTEKIPETAVKQDFFIKDLKKSLFIIFLIITLEIIVYFVTIKDYLKLGY